MVLTVRPKSKSETAVTETAVLLENPYSPYPCERAERHRTREASHAPAYDCNVQLKTCDGGGSSRSSSSREREGAVTDSHNIRMITRSK